MSNFIQSCKKFLVPPIGSTNLSNREIWLEETLKKIPRDDKILDAGAGELKYKKFCSHLRYVSQDFAQYDGKGDDKGLQTEQWDQTKLDIISDITSIPEPDESFDAIMCIEVFEHLPAPILAIKEFSRLLKKGGILIITAPFCSLTHFAPYHFYSGFNRYFYEKYLTEFGFKIDELTSNGNFYEFLGQETRRISAISDKYLNRKTSFCEKILILFFLKVLQKYSKLDNKNKSSEILNFGFHVKAIKEAYGNR
jgi:ubiquinone/menaquinone biosynthesis C-methylase UbiE